MIRLNLFVLTTILAAMAACKNKKAQETKPPTNDSLASVKAIINEDSLMISRNNIPNWITTRLKKNGLEWNRLRLEEYAREEKHPEEPFSGDRSFFTDYAEVLKWSPDSSYVVDLGSYGSVLVKDKKGNMHVEAGEPDTEISLLNIKARQKRRLFFVGPSSVIIDGTWADTSNALILGSFDEKGNNQPDTLFWLINVKENFYRMYKWKR